MKTEGDPSRTGGVPGAPNGVVEARSTPSAGRLSHSGRVPFAALEALLGQLPQLDSPEAAQAWLEALSVLWPLPMIAADEARALEARAQVLSRWSLPEAAHRESYRDAARAAELFEDADQPIRAGAAYAFAACGAAHHGHVRSALDIAVRALLALASGEQESEDQVIAQMADRMAMLCLILDDLERAVDFAEEAVRRADRTSDPVTWSLVRRDLGEILLLLTRDPGPGQRPRATRSWLARLRELAAELTEHGEPAHLRRVTAPQLTAAVLLRGGDAAAAWPLLEQAAQAAAQAPGPGPGASLPLIRAQCLLALDRPEEALTELDAASAAFVVYDGSTHRGWALELGSAARAATGDLAGALQQSSELVAWMRRRHRRQVRGFMDQVFTRAGVEGEHRRLLERAEDLSRTAEEDPLTGLMNRRGMERFLFEHAPDEQLCVVMIDVDHFKEVNDRNGHPAGDRVLLALAGLLSHSSRSVDRVARWGGEEFVVVVPGDEPSVGTDAAERLRQLVEESDWESVLPGLALTVSAGVAVGPAAEVQDLLQRADAAMYEAKRAGRNRVVEG